MIGSAGGAPELGRLLTLMTSGKLNPAASERASGGAGRGDAPAQTKAGGRPRGCRAAAFRRQRGGLKLRSRGCSGSGRRRTREQLLTEGRQGRSGWARCGSRQSTVCAELGGAAVDPDIMCEYQRVAARGRRAARRRRGAGQPRSPRFRRRKIAAVLNDLTNAKEHADAWRAIISGKGAPDQVADLVSEGGTLPSRSTPAAMAAGLRVARELPGQERAKARRRARRRPARRGSCADSGFLRVLATYVLRDGDPARGEEIYRRTTLALHHLPRDRRRGREGRPGADFAGASAPLDYIIESVVAPAAKVKEGTSPPPPREGRHAAVGIPVRETAQELYLRNAAGQDQPVVKANIATKEIIGSIMPAGPRLSNCSRASKSTSTLSSRSLGKPGVYDASKGDVARYWALYPGAPGPNRPAPPAPGRARLHAGRRWTHARLLKNALQFLPNAAESMGRRPIPAPRRRHGQPEPHRRRGGSAGWQARELPGGSADAADPRRRRAPWASGSTRGTCPKCCAWSAPSAVSGQLTGPRRVDNCVDLRRHRPMSRHFQPGREDGSPRLQLASSCQGAPAASDLAGWRNVRCARATTGSTSTSHLARTAARGATNVYQGYECASPEARKFHDLLAKFETAMLVTHSADQGLRGRPMADRGRRCRLPCLVLHRGESGKVEEIVHDTHVAVVCQKDRDLSSL